MVEGGDEKDHRRRWWPIQSGSVQNSVVATDERVSCAWVGFLRL